VLVTWKAVVMSCYRKKISRLCRNIHRLGLALNEMLHLKHANFRWYEKTDWTIKIWSAKSELKLGRCSKQEKIFIKLRLIRGVLKLWQLKETVYAVAAVCWGLLIYSTAAICYCFLCDRTNRPHYWPCQSVLCGFLTWKRKAAENQKDGSSMTLHG